MAAGARGGAAAFLESVAQIHASSLKRGSAAEKNAGEKRRGESEEKDRKIEAHVSFGGQSERRHHNDDDFQHRPRETNAKNAADGREREAFCEELCEELTARRAEGGADGDFFLANGAAGEQKIGHVDAGNQQDESHRAHEQPNVLDEFRTDEIVLHLISSGLMKSFCSFSTEAPQPLLETG